MFNLTRSSAAKNKLSATDKINFSMEHWWNDSAWGKPKHSEKTFLNEIYIWNTWVFLCVNNSYIKLVTPAFKKLAFIRQNLFVVNFSLILCSCWTLVTELFLNLRRSSYKLPVNYVRSGINLNCLGRLVSKYFNIKFHKNPSNGNRVVPWTERQIDITKLTFAFCNFVNLPKSSRLIKTALS
jgi:hypothetical protein